MLTHLETTSGLFFGSQTTAFDKLKQATARSSKTFLMEIFRSFGDVLDTSALQV